MWKYFFSCLKIFRIFIWTSKVEKCFNRLLSRTRKFCKSFTSLFSDNKLIIEIMDWNLVWFENHERDSFSRKRQTDTQWIHSSLLYKILINIIDCWRLLNFFKINLTIGLIHLLHSERIEFFSYLISQSIFGCLLMRKNVSRHWLSLEFDLHLFENICSVRKAASEKIIDLKWSSSLFGINHTKLKTRNSLGNWTLTVWTGTGSGMNFCSLSG